MVKECCASCARKKDLINYDYSSKGCHHIPLSGYACTILSDEGKMVWMTGENPNEGWCEGYYPKDVSAT